MWRCASDMGGLPNMCLKQVMLFTVAFCATCLFVLGCADKPTVPEVVETTISGRVIDATTDHAINGATVSTEPTTEQPTTNADGQYVLRASVAVGERYRITASASGYLQNTAEVVAKEGETRIADLKLTPSAPELAASPDSLVFDPDRQKQTLIVGNTGTGVLHWEVTTDEDWLVAVPTNGETAETDAPVEVSVDRSRVDANGTFRSALVITSDGGTKSIPVIMVVVGMMDVPELAVSPVSLAFGSTSSRLSVGVTNEGRGDLIWEATISHAWISVNPSADTTGSGGTAPLVISVDRGKLDPGEHQGSVDVVSNGGSYSVPITISIPRPVLAINSREADFRGDLERITLQVSNIGSGELVWGMRHAPPWLAVEPDSAITARVSTPVVLTVRRDSLQAGEHRASILLVSNSTSEPQIEIEVIMQVPESPLLRVTPDSLDFGTGTVELGLEIANANNGELTWQLETDALWLSLDGTSGQLGLLGGTHLSATVDREGLQARVYEGQITVSSNGGTINVPVTMDVPQNPILAADMQTLALTDSAPIGSIRIWNAGTGRLSWETGGDQEWLRVSPESGTTLSEEDTLAVAAQTGQLPAGRHEGEVLISSDGGEWQTVVELVVAERPVLEVSPTGIDLGLDLADRQLILTNAGNVPVSWAVSGASTWLQLSANAGDLSLGAKDSLVVSVRRDNLEPGMHEAALKLESEAGSLEIPVSMEVGRPLLVTSPDVLHFVAGITRQEVVVRNDGNAALAWTLSAEETWAQVSETGGELATGEETILQIAVVREGLAFGTYRTMLSLRSNGGDRDLPISLAHPDPSQEGSIEVDIPWPDDEDP